MWNLICFPNLHLKEANTSVLSSKISDAIDVSSSRSSLAFGCLIGGGVF
ncbi:MAG: hypothetical protein R2771_10355 [Saprospiraceae bacterium]